MKRTTFTARLATHIFGIFRNQQLTQNEIIKANQKIQNTQNVELQNPLQAVDLPQEIKESQNNVESPSQEEATSVQSNNLNAQSN